MRTTVTLDPDSLALIHQRMQPRGTSFKQALNEAIREGLGGRSGATYRTGTAKLGIPSADLDRALQLAAELEDDELIRKVRVGK